MLSKCANKIINLSLPLLQATIPDPDDKKPEDWDKPETIPDPEATRPDDWDDEMVSNR